MKKFAKMLVCFLVGLFSLVCGVACGEPPTITLVDEFFRDSVMLNREFEITTVLEDYNEKYEYEITECFYLDNLDGLKRYDIPVTDKTKFTQSAPYDVHVVLVAKSFGKTTDLEFTLKLEIPEDDMQTEMISSWCESGVSKKIDAAIGYVLDGEESSVKVTYLGDNQPDQTNGVNIGSFVCNSEDASLTGWENVVMSFSVFNPQEYDLQMGWMASQNKLTWNNVGYMQDAVTLKAGEWTKINWSLRAVGLNWNFNLGTKYEIITIYFKVRIKDPGDMVDPYNYTMYFGGMDLADYSAEKFPDLETRTKEEILLASPGEMEDKWIGGNYTEKSTDISRWYTTSLSSSIKEYGAEQVKAVETSTAFVEYNMKATAVNKNEYVGNFLDFSSTARPIHEDLYEASKDIDWSKAYITFYACNNTPNATCRLLGMGDGKYGDMITELPYGEWKKVSVSLKNYFNITTDVFTGAYEIKLYVQYLETGCHTAETYENFASSLYIDEFKFESTSGAGFYEGGNAWYAGNYTPLSTKILRWYTTALAVTEKEYEAGQAKPYDGSQSYLEYAMIATANNNNEYVGNFLDFSGENPIDSTVYAEKFKDMDWSNAKLTFWAYNASDFNCQIRGWNATDGKYGDKVTDLAAKTWTKVSVPISVAITESVYNAGTYDIKLFVRFAETGCHTAETYQNFAASLFVAGLTFEE